MSEICQAGQCSAWLCCHWQCCPEDPSSKYANYSTSLFVPERRHQAGWGRHELLLFSLHDHALADLLLKWEKSIWVHKKAIRNSGRGGTRTPLSRRDTRNVIVTLDCFIVRLLHLLLLLLQPSNLPKKEKKTKRGSICSGNGNRTGWRNNARGNLAVFILLYVRLQKLTASFCPFSIIQIQVNLVHTGRSHSNLLRYLFRPILSLLIVYSQTSWLFGLRWIVSSKRYGVNGAPSFVYCPLPDVSS